MNLTALKFGYLKILFSIKKLNRIVDVKQNQKFRPRVDGPTLQIQQWLIKIDCFFCIAEDRGSLSPPAFLKKIYSFRSIQFHNSEKFPKVFWIPLQACKAKNKM